MTHPYVVDAASIDGDTLDGALLKADGCQGIIARAELGTWLDPDFQKHRKVAQDAGLMWGGYLYVNWAKPIEQQAEIFFKALGPLGPGCFPPIPDLEEGNLKKGPAFNGQPRAVVLGKLMTFCQMTIAHYGGIKVLGYSSARVLHEGLHDPDMSAFVPLLDWWLAHYDVGLPKDPPVPPGWPTWTMHQYRGDKAGLPGVKGQVDVSRFNPALGDMRAYFDAMWARACPPAKAP